MADNFWKFMGLIFLIAGMGVLLKNSSGASAILEGLGSFNRQTIGALNGQG